MGIHVLRGPRRIPAYCDGPKLLGPGAVSCPPWRPGTAPEPADVHGAVAHER
ncbi:hypothetical protein [Streptomyces fructofermentans]|uniref:Uncharacterized protein n=1 Tax=Streptomyces fructofermentans TaxID=152141 RepID=A0A918KAR2_9ACTN|nr:hypothetical protein [Streptomyces fructofermentans]GGX57172.1 hypothetical protein GCM10010515_25900 [Streptomyces fructofermentans]